ncbi:MAG: AAA family ATPase [Desulfobacterales bacterium]
MDYFSLLNLEREPFSNSPDPDFFYQSRQHLDCLQKLELSLHLRRGLNVVLGEVGTGKTTLCRHLIRRFARRPEIETHLILDPSFRDGADFLATVVRLLTGRRLPAEVSEWQAKEAIKQILFRKGVEQKKTTVLIIDEGQKIPPFCLELLREFLNYETNAYKLLQIVIFAQREFEETLRRHPNFGDRINLLHRLKPLDFGDTRRMIRFRLERSSASPQPLDLFTLPALWAIHRATGGFPRKIINLCHQCILAMIIQNAKRVGYATVRRCAARVVTAEAPARTGRRAAAWGATAAALAALLLWAFSAEVSPLDRLRGRLRGVFPPAAPGRTLSPDPPRGIVETRPIPQAEPAAEAAEAPVAQAPDAARREDPTPSMASGETGRSAAEAAAAVFGERAPLAAEQKAAQAQEGPPAILGEVRLQRGETVSGVIQRVYGQYSNRHFRAVILANPLIDDPDRILAGRTLRLPAVETLPRALNKPAWWVKINEFANLEEALAALRNPPDSLPAMRLIPLWEPRQGLRFLLVLRQVFFDRETALLQISLLPRHTAAAAGLIGSWEGAVLYADPYPAEH